MSGETGSRRSAVPSPEEGKFVAAVAHEINNPLESLLNLLYLLDGETNLSQPGRNLLRLAQQEARRATNITRSAVTQFQVSGCAEEANVPSLLRSVLEFYQSRFESRGISIATQYCSDGNLLVYSDPLRRSFANLLLNAADSMPEGGKIQVRVSASREWAGRERRGLRVTIADNGCGIEKGAQSEVWRPFFTTKGTAGTGTGLCVVQDTVQKHDGVLRLRSSTRHGRSGSVFTVFLPAA
jgi:signal transduction histidine kinase